MNGLVALVAELVAALDPDSEIRYRRQLAREAYQRGYSAGQKAGYEHAARDMAAAWHAAAVPVSRGGPSYAELERRRWGPEGRERFGEPRPGQYPGRARKWDAA
jgi:hypothetical protein